MAHHDYVSNQVQENILFQTQISREFCPSVNEVALSVVRLEDSYL